MGNRDGLFQGHLGPIFHVGGAQDVFEHDPFSFVGVPVIDGVYYCISDRGVSR